MSLDINFACTDLKKNNALHLATMNGNTKMVFKLMFKFGKFNQKNLKGESALSLAKRYEFNNIEAVFVGKPFQQLTARKRARSSGV